MHTNKINDKKYVGITSRYPKIRWGNNGCGYRESQPCFRNAIQKYGWNNFEHEIIANNLTLEEANELEKELIKKYHTCIYDEECHGYNMTYGGDEGRRNTVVSDETKLKMSIAHTGEKNGFYGKHHSEETKELLSLQRKGNNTGEDNSFYGKQHSEETKNKLSKFASERTGEKNPNYGNHKLAGENHPWYGKHLPKETRDKISKSRIGKYTGKNSPNAKPVICLELNKIFDTGKQAAEELDLDASSISKCCKGKVKSVKGYTFEYVNKEINKNIETN